jgi:hypothetical protein
VLHVTTDSQPAISPRERVAMKKMTRLLALLVVLSLLALLVAKPKHLTTEEAVDDAVGTAEKVEDTAVRQKYVAVAFLVLLALLAFVTWTALRAKEGQDRAMPPPGKQASEEEIRTLAYDKWEAAGRPPGDGEQFWLEAEKELHGKK